MPIVPGYIQVPPDSTGKKTATRTLVVGADTVQRQQMEMGLIAPQLTYVTSASVAAGASATLDSAQLTASMTGRLWGVLVAASVAFRAEVFTVANDVASGVKAAGISFTGSWMFTAPDPAFITVPYSATAGLDGFRVVVTNLDYSEPSDVGVTFFFDEELT